MRDEADYWEMPAGTRLDIGTTAIEYIGEFTWDEYHSDTLDAMSTWVITLPNDRTIRMSEVETTYGRDVAAEWEGITFDTINSGYLIRMTNDSEGAYVARHWGK